MAANGIGAMVGDSDNPNPEDFKVQMRTARAGEDSAMRHDDFVGSYNNTGRIKLDKKKWTPSKPEEGENAFRSEDWMGSGKTQRKTWTPKSSSNIVRADDASKPAEFVRSNSESARKWNPPPKDSEVSPPWMGSPATTSSTARKQWQPKSQPKAVNASTENNEMNASHLQSGSNHSSGNDALNHTPHEDNDCSDDQNYEVASDDEAEVPVVQSEAKEKPPRSEPNAAPGGAAGYVVEDDYDKPNPEDYKVHMRTARASEDSAMRHDDFVGSYNNTGRIKLDKKKWTPTKPNEGESAFRSEDWMGSGKTQRKSWKPKSSTNMVRADEASKPPEFVRSNSESARKWNPTPKDNEVSPPWMGSPATTSSSTRKQWQPKSQPKPVNASTENSEMNASQLQSGSNHSSGNGDDTRLSESMNHMSLSSPQVGTTAKAWQSHGALNHTPHGDNDHDSTEDAEIEANKDDCSDDHNYEVASDDEAEVPVVKSEEKEKPTRAEPNTAPGGAAGYVVEDDYDKPNPEDFKVQMRTARAGEDSAMRHDDFVGSYNNTGRIKLDKKKWTPSKPEEGENAFRSEDWMGSGKTQRKTWKVKK